MGDHHTAVPEPLVLQKNNRPVEGWSDERGRLTRRPLFSADSIPSDHPVTEVAELEEVGFLALHRHEQAEICCVLSREDFVPPRGGHRASPGSGRDRLHPRVP
ncbi:hypothetical protein [Kocuria sp.]|uniref:hypothetical protein n=1 Tax=Kocuria sp. TaxID=1871328 RepID=UPI002810EADA|nr:hypothetical protein [Kocuria sp.]